MSVLNILSEGHSVGNHTYNHKILSTLTKEETDFQISSVNNLFAEIFFFFSECA